MATHYPVIAGDPPLGHKKAETWRRKEALWTAYESAGNDAFNQMQRFSVLNTSTLAPKTDPFRAQRTRGAFGKSASATPLAPRTTLRDAMKNADAMDWPPPALNVPERTRNAADDARPYAIWAARFEADTRVCEAWAREVVECKDRQSLIGGSQEAGGPPELWWNGSWVDPSRPYRPAIQRRDLIKLVDDGPSLAQYLEQDGWVEPLRPVVPTLRLAVDPCRPPFEALRFACQAVGAQDLAVGGANPRAAVVAGGCQAAGEFVAAFFPGHRILLSRRALRPVIGEMAVDLPKPKDTDELKMWWPWKMVRGAPRVGRVIVNLPPGRALRYVARMGNEDAPTLRPVEHEAFRRGPVSNPFFMAEEIIEAAVRVLLPGGTLVLLGGVEFGEHHYGNDLLKEHGLEPAPVGSRGVDTVRRPLWFRYEAGAWGEGQGPWAPWGCLWPSSRLASVWRMPS